MSEENYPYVEEQEYLCYFNYYNIYYDVSAKVTGVVRIDEGNEDDLLAAVATIVSVIWILKCQ